MEDATGEIMYMDFKPDTAAVPMVGCAKSLPDNPNRRLALFLDGIPIHLHVSHMYRNTGSTY
jgi:hypothetical protein